MIREVKPNVLVMDQAGLAEFLDQLEAEQAELDADPTGEREKVARLMAERPDPNRH